MNNKNIGATIFNLRKSKNLTQKQLSEIIFVSQKAISKWETGDGVPEFTNLMELAKVFNVSVDYILQGLGSEGVENLNTTHKRYNTALQNENESQNKNENQKENKIKDADEDGTKQTSEENKKENSLDNNDNDKKEDSSNKPKRSVDEILSLVDNITKKSANATKTTLTLANEASQNRMNEKNQNSAGKKKKKPKLNLIAFLINILLCGIVAYNISANYNSYGIHYLTIFSFYLILLIVASVIILSVISLTGKDVKKSAKIFAILNIIIACLAVLLLFINNYGAGLFGFNINNFFNL